MSTKVVKTAEGVRVTPRTPEEWRVSELLKQYGCGPIPFVGSENALYERHLVFDRVIDPKVATARERFEAVAHSIRDILAQRWVLTRSTYNKANPKRVYYLSMEFLLGRSLTNNIGNLLLSPLVQYAVKEKELDWLKLIEEEPDAGLGNGGLGRLAACFLDSMATMELPATGYGLRYEYGMFKQSIVDGWQKEHPDSWIRMGDPWEVVRAPEMVEVKLGCSFKLIGGSIQVLRGRPSTLIGIPFDRPVVGYGGKTINTLRLWAAAAPNYFDFQEFGTGDFVGALGDTLEAESLTRVLYPDDSTTIGQGLRFIQEYFLVACSLADIVRRFRRFNQEWALLPEKAAIQLNDTHPSLAVAELMRILLDDAQLGWDQAWDLTKKTLAYTNHTLLPEALEKWPVELFEMLIPRHLEIIYEINRRVLDEVRLRFPGDDGRTGASALLKRAPNAKSAWPTWQLLARTAQMASPRSTRTSADDHGQGSGRDVSRALQQQDQRGDAAAMVAASQSQTGRRHLECHWRRWITNLSELSKLKPLADDAAFATLFSRQSAKPKCDLRIG